MLAPGAVTGDEIMGRKRIWPPRVHRNGGNERVYWMGEWYHLGPADSPAAAAKPAEPTVLELAADYLASDAVTDAQRKQTLRALDLLNEQHAETPIAEFGPRALAAWQSWLCPGRRRTYVLKLVNVVRGMFRWAVATERLPETNYRALLTVDPPRRSEARPGKVVTAADPAHVEAVLPFLLPPVRAILELLLL